MRTELSEIVVMARSMSTNAIVSAASVSSATTSAELSVSVLAAIRFAAPSRIISVRRNSDE